MPGHTRRDIRRFIGHDLQGTQQGGMVLRTATAFTSTTLTDTGFIGQADEPRGKYVVIEGHVARVSSFEASVLTFAPAIPGLPADGGEYELWDQKYHPQQINSLINSAIVDAQTNGVLRHAMKDDAYLPPTTTRIKAPDDWLALREIEMSDISTGYTTGGGTYFDLLQFIRDIDGAEGDDTTYPFHTIKVIGQKTLTIDQTFPLGLYDKIGYEVAGEFSPDPGDVAVTDSREFRFFVTDFDHRTVTKDSEGYALLNIDGGSTGAWILAAYLYREAQVHWNRASFTVWQGSGEIEIPYYDTGDFIIAEGCRLRLHGGEALRLPDLGVDGDDDELDVSSSYARAQALVSLLRSVPTVIIGEDGTPVRREWEVQAAREMAQLDRMQGVRYLR